MRLAGGQRASSGWPRASPSRKISLSRAPRAISLARGQPRTHTRPIIHPRGGADFSDSVSRSPVLRADFAAPRGSRGKAAPLNSRLRAEPRRDVREGGSAQVRAPSAAHRFLANRRDDCATAILPRSALLEFYRALAALIEPPPTLSAAFAARQLIYEPHTNYALSGLARVDQ